MPVALTPPAPPVRPTPEPERSTLTPPIRPITIIKPVERIERTFIEREPRTEPVPVPVAQPPVRETIIIERTPDGPQPPRDITRIEKERNPDGHRDYEPPVVARRPEPPNEKSSAQPTKTIPEKSSEPNKNSSPINSESIRQTIPNNSEPELISPDKPAPQADASGFKKVGKVGRQRRYDELGIDDIEPIKEVVLFRHQMGRHWPGLSKDMEAYYEQMYFTKPNKRKDGKDYDKHVKCWERRERWLAVTTGAAQTQSA